MSAHRVCLPLLVSGVLASLLACSAPRDAGAPSAEHLPAKGSADVNPDTHEQTELDRKRHGTKLQGVIEVPGYEKGFIHIDVFEPGADPVRDRPITKTRIDKPGPFVVYLPKGTTSVDVRGILDLAGDGPTYDDAFCIFSGNPVAVSKGMAPITFIMDKNAHNKPPPGMDGNGDKPPWERTDGNAGPNPGPAPAPPPPGLATH